MTWMDVEGIVRSEISRGRTRIIWSLLHAELKNINQAHRYREQIGVCHRWGEGGLNKWAN